MALMDAPLSLCAYLCISRCLRCSGNIHLNRQYRTVQADSASNSSRNTCTNTHRHAHTAPLAYLLTAHVDIYQTSWQDQQTIEAEMVTVSRKGETNVQSKTLKAEA